MHEGHRKRLRDSYMQGGADALHDHQLLELLLTFSIPRKDTNPIAHALLAAFGSLDGVLHADVTELEKVEGVGESTALLLSIIGALPSRMAYEKGKPVRLTTPKEAMTYCCTLLSQQRYEVMYIISLDKNLRVLYCEKLSSGTLTETTVYPRLVVESALRHNAHSIVLAHNHPSGDLTPSRADVEATAAMLRALEPIGIRLHDHIIVSKNNAFSMARDSLMPNGGEVSTLAAVAERQTPVT